jgi:hypothetical protein
MRKMHISLFLFLLANSQTLLAIPPEQAAAKISAKFDAVEQVARIQFTLPKEVKFNFDGPWKLELTGPIVTVGKVLTPQEKKDFNKDSAQFFFATHSKITKAQAEQSSWNVTYFLCDEKVTWCKKLNAKGNFK